MGHKAEGEIKRWLSIVLASVIVWAIILCIIFGLIALGKAVL